MQPGFHMRAERTPNPNSIKWILGEPMLPSGRSAHFEQPVGPEVSPLAARLFAVEGVTGVFVAPSFVTVTKREDVEWADVAQSLVDAIKASREAGDGHGRQGPAVGKGRHPEAPAAIDGEGDLPVLVHPERVTLGRHPGRVNLDGGVRPEQRRGGHPEEGIDLAHDHEQDGQDGRDDDDAAHHDQARRPAVEPDPASCPGPGNDQRAGRGNRPARIVVHHYAPGIELARVLFDRFLIESDEKVDVAPYAISVPGERPHSRSRMSSPYSR